MEGKIFCADDFLLSGHSRSHKACTECGSPVTNKLVQVTTRHSQSVSVLTLLQAVTGYYHSHCFKCKLCQKPLASEEYSVDQDNQVLALSHSVTLSSLSQVYCLEDFCYLFGPKCGRCKKTIYPVENTAILIRVKASSAQAGVS